MPKEAILARRTTKTLAATIRRLFERSEVTAEDFARDIGLQRKSLYHLFTGTNGIKYKVLERIERRLGIPTGIILCISHSTALIREAHYNKDADKRHIARAGIDVMAAYLDHLHTALAEPAHHPKRTAYVDKAAHDMGLWREMMDEIMDVTLGTDDRLAPTVFTDPIFIANRPITKRVKNAIEPSGKPSKPKQTSSRPRKATRKASSVRADQMK